MRPWSGGSPPASATQGPEEKPFLNLCSQKAAQPW